MVRLTGWGIVASQARSRQAASSFVLTETRLFDANKKLFLRPRLELPMQNIIFRDHEST